MAGGWTRSSLVFDGDLDATVEKVAVVGTTDFFTGGSTSFQLAAGGFLAGTLEADGIERDMGPGWLASGSATWRVVDGTGAAPYVLLTLTLGATGTRTFVDPPEAGAAPLRGSYLAFDARFGAAVGKTFFDRVSPYAAVRAFGGPVIWSEGDTTRNGTDRYHLQLAAGAALLLDPVDVFVEGAPLGEQAITGGVGLRF